MLPSLILTPTMMGARALGVLLTPVGWLQKAAGSKLSLPERLLRYATTLPGEPTGSQIAVLIAVVLGILVSPVLIVLGVVGVLVARSNR